MVDERGGDVGIALAGTDDCVHYYNSAFDVCDLGGDDLSFIPVPAIVNIYNTEI